MLHFLIQKCILNSGRTQDIVKIHFLDTKYCIFVADIDNDFNMKILY